MLTASCHCGDVQIELDAVPTSVTECTCTICRRYGARWAYNTRRTARVVSDPDRMSAYVWGDRELEFFHCKRCGCLTHYESVEKNDDSRIAVNARMMSPDDVAGATVRVFDGADTWCYLDEA